MDEDQPLTYDTDEEEEQLLMFNVNNNEYTSLTSTAMSPICHAS